jgi:serine/threonine-protein kinase
VQAVIAKVIMDRPASVRATRELVPAHVDAAIARSLAKLPADRFTTASDFARALTGEHALVPLDLAARAPGARLMRAGPIGALGAVLVARPVVRRAVFGTIWMALLGGAGAIGAIAALAWFAVPPAPYQKFPVLIPDSVTIGGSGRSVAISPDGRHVALVGAMIGQSSRLLARPMAGVAFTPLHGTDAAVSPAFSPDGANLLYGARGRLWRVSSQGGTPLPLADSTDGGHSWGDANQVVFTRRGALWRVASSGGTAQLVSRPDSAGGVRALAWPEVLPGSKHALVTIVRQGSVADSSHIGVVSLADGDVTDLGFAGTGARFAAPGHIIYATPDGSLWVAPFSVRKRAITGPKSLLASGVSVDASGAADVTVSSTGTVIYGANLDVAPGASNRRVAVTIVDSAGTVKATGGQVGEYYSPRVSPDGARIALTVREAATRVDVWIYEVATGQLTPMTRDAMSLLPEWADTRRVVFRQAQILSPGIYLVQPWDHSAAAVPFLRYLSFGGRGTGAPAGLSVGPPSGYLALVIFPGGPRPRPTRQDILIAPMARPNEYRDFVATDASELSPRVSPNGRWLAYTSNESGTFQLYVMPVPGPGPRTPISIGHGTEPVWSRDGRTLYYVSRGSLLAARIDESSGFRATRQDTLFNFEAKGYMVLAPPRTNANPTGFYDVFPNGGFAVLSRTAGTDSSRSSVIALLNWQQMLRQGAAQGAAK